MRKILMVICCFLLCACGSVKEDIESLIVTTSTTTTTTSTTKAPTVYTASKTTKVQEPVTTTTSPSIWTTAAQESEMPETIVVTTYPVTTGKHLETSYVTELYEEYNEYTEEYVTSIKYVPVEVEVEDKAQDTFEFTPAYDGVTDVGYEAIKRINEYRREKGLEEYELDVDLCLAANLRAREIVDVYNHVRIDYSKFNTVLDEFGISYTAAAESIGSGISNANSMCYVWYQNGTERKNILDNSYHFKKIGVGYYYYAGKSYWVMLLVK